MPTGYATKNFVKLDVAFTKGYTTASLQGSSRSSKTYSIVQWLIRRCYDNAGTSVSVVRKTMPALKRSVFRDFKEIMMDWGIWNDRCMNNSEFVYRFDNGSWIEFFSCENEQKLRGSKRQILFVNEANEISFLEWQQLQMRTTLFSIIDYNPSFSEEHWINQVNLESRTCFWISTYKDNPFLEQKVIDEIESLQWKNKSLWQVYGLGLRAVVEGLVFPEIEIIDHIPREATRHRYAGMDFGYSNDPTAIIEVCFWKDAIYLNELCYQTHMLTSDIIRELKGIDWQPEIISESADPRLVDEIYNAGIDIKAVHKFQGSINAGLTKMKEYKIYITRQSVNLIKEFRNYTYRQDKEGKWLNEPIDCYNHCFVGNTLVATPNGDCRIDRLKIGDFVCTSKGNRKVSKFFDNGCRKVLHIRIVFRNFAIEVEATPDHKIKTQNGWKELQQLRAADVVYLHKSLWERNTTCIKTNDTSREAQKGFIGLYGNILTEKSQTGVISTIKTGTSSTTILKTSKCTKGANIFIFMHKSIYNPKSILGKLERIWQRLRKQPKSGIIQKRVGNGIKNTEKKLLKTLSPLNLYACNVVNTSSQNQQGSTNSAPIIANQNGAEITTSTTKYELVSNAEKSLLSTNIVKQDAVVKAVVCDMVVLNESYKNVYDIEVEEAHEFFANGVLVHNCIDAIRYVILEKILGGYGKGLSATEILGLM